MTENTPNKNEHEAIATEITRMFEEDQAMRERAFKNDGVIETDEDADLDRKNTLRMKEIVAQIGWPTASKVGNDGAHMAWLLVQHADHDVAFQATCLELMKQAGEGEVSKIDIAYLEDRVRVNQGKPQLYGTQFFREGDSYGPRPIEDYEHVDDRRRALGLGSLEEYRQSLLDKYRK